MANRYQRQVDGQTRSIPEHNVITFPLLASSVDTSVFAAVVPCEVTAVTASWSVVGGASAAVGVKKCTGTQAPASGTAITSADFDLTSTINTVGSKTVASGLTTTAATRKLAVGDRIALDFTGTLTGLVGHINIFVTKLQSAGADR